MLKNLFGGQKTVSPVKLPAVNSFVDAVVGGRASRSVTVEACGQKGIVTRDVLGRPGELAILIYNTQTGRYRAATKIVSTTSASTLFEFPKRVDLVGAAQGAQKRSSVRLDTLVVGSWRFAPDQHRS